MILLSIHFCVLTDFAWVCTLYMYYNSDNIAQSKVALLQMIGLRKVWINTFPTAQWVSEEAIHTVAILDAEKCRNKRRNDSL